MNPDLVARDDEGKAYTVRYEAVNAMLLNEFIKEHRRNETQQQQLDALSAVVKRASDADPEGEWAIVGDTGRAASCKQLFELLKREPFDSQQPLFEGRTIPYIRYWCSVRY